MLTGMPSTLMARSVPWSRLKPRRKYWLALPSPECWVTIRPGTTSSASPARANGTAFTSAPLMRMALAAVGCSAAAPSDEAPGVTPLAPAVTGWFERTAVLLRAPRFCAGFGRATRLGGVAFGSGDGDRRKLARRELPSRSCAVAGEHQNGRRSGGGKYPQQDPTHRHAPA